MKYIMRFSLAFVAAVCLAQSPDVNQRLLEEMKGVRAALNRMVQLLETMEKTQVALLALQQVLGYESQLRTLQSQQSQFATQERDLSTRVAALEEAARTQEGGVDPGGLKVPGGVQDARSLAETQERLASAKRSLDEIRGRLKSVDQESAALRSRIEQQQKALEGARR